MYRNSYHMLAVHEPPSAGGGELWVRERLADARADLLHRLGLSSAGLRLRGLRLLFEAPPLPPRALSLAEPARLGITMRVVAVDDHITIAEAVHAITDFWRRQWQGHSFIRVVEDDLATPLPPDLYRRAVAWLGLVRGTIPTEAMRKTTAGTGRRPRNPLAGEPAD